MRSAERRRPTHHFRSPYHDVPLSNFSNRFSRDVTYNFTHSSMICLCIGKSTILSQFNPIQIVTNFSLEADLNQNSTKTNFSLFIHQCLYSPLLGHGLFFSFVIFFTQSVRLLGRVISPSQGRYLHTGQQKQRISAHTDIHAIEWDSKPRSQHSS
jgi:hypothetical protein